MSLETFSTARHTGTRASTGIVTAGVHGLPPDWLRECSGRLGIAALGWGPADAGALSRRLAVRDVGDRWTAGRPRAGGAPTSPSLPWQGAQELHEADHRDEEESR